MRHSWRLGATAATLALLVVAAPTAAQRQSNTAWAAVGGAALGGASGLIAGTLGSVVPCTATFAGPHCVRWIAAGSGLLGGVAGGVLGGTEPAALEGRAVGGLIGLGVGTVVGASLTPVIQRWAPEDALAVGMVGGVIGAAPVGAALGFGVGAVVGVAAWRLVPGGTGPGAVGTALAGLAVGVLAEWVVRAATADQDLRTVSFHVRF